MYIEIFRVNVKLLAKERDLTNIELSQISGVSPSFLSDLSRGKANPSLKVMGYIAEALGSSLPDLLTYEGSSKGPLYLPQGYSRVTVILTKFQKYRVKKMEEENLVNLEKISNKK